MVVGRLAPSPTGAQHLGNARTFLIAWLSIRAKNGHLILRIEDIDSPRVKPWAIEQAMHDLTWLGLDWDEGPDNVNQEQGTRTSENKRTHRKYIQSERMSLYESALDRLKSAEKVYPCICSRSDVTQSASAPHELGDGPIYGQTCRSRTAKEAASLQVPFAWRFKTEDELLSFVDGYKGRLDLNIGTALGDFVVYKNDVSPAYQLSVVVDDHEMQITEVLRGDDLIPSAFRQIALYDFFDWQVPEFIHVPLVVGPDGRRLAKRHGDTRLSFFREQGVRPERIIGLLAHSLGWIDSPTEVAAHDLIDQFDLATIPEEPLTIGPNEIEWLFGSSV